MRRTATSLAVCALVGSAGTAVAVAACPPGGEGAPGDTTSTTETTTTASGSLREYEGTVVSVSNSARKFKLRTDSGKKVTIKVKKSTDFGEGVSSLRGLKRGDDDVEVTARKTRNGLVATDVGCPDKGDGEEGGDDTPPAPPAGS